MIFFAVGAGVWVMTPGSRNPIGRPRQCPPFAYVTELAGIPLFVLQYPFLLSSFVSFDNLVLSYAIFLSSCPSLSFAFVIHVFLVLSFSCLPFFRFLSLSFISIGVGRRNLTPASCPSLPINLFYFNALLPFLCLHVLSQTVCCGAARNCWKTPSPPESQPKTKKHGQGNPSNKHRPQEWVLL